MFHQISRITGLAIGFCLFGQLTACDPEGSPDAVEDARANLVAELAITESIAPKDWEALEWPPVAPHSDILAPAPPLDTKFHPWSFETFTFSTTELISVTSASGGLFAPFPADITPLDEPVISNGVIFAAKFRNLNGDIVAFGTEQEVVDFEAAISLTTYTITVPGRGTLMLKQREDVSGLLDRANDMIANEDHVRTFDPPLEIVTTIPGTGLIVGGSGEFAGAFGFMREINILAEINLMDGTIDDFVIVQVLIL